MKQLTLALLTSCLTIAHAHAMYQASRPLNRIADRSLTKQLNKKFSSEAPKPTDPDDLKKIIKLLEEKNKIHQKNQDMAALIVKGYIGVSALSLAGFGLLIISIEYGNEIRSKIEDIKEKAKNFIK